MSATELVFDAYVQYREYISFVKGELHDFFGDTLSHQFRSHLIHSLSAGLGSNFNVFQPWMV